MREEDLDRLSVFYITSRYIGEDYQFHRCTCIGSMFIGPLTVLGWRLVFLHQQNCSDLIFYYRRELFA